MSEIQVGVYPFGLLSDETYKDAIVALEQAGTIYFPGASLVFKKDSGNETITVVYPAFFNGEDGQYTENQLKQIKDTNPSSRIYVYPNFEDSYKTSDFQYIAHLHH